jgi:hypothetical protein
MGGARSTSAAQARRASLPELGTLARRARRGADQRGMEGTGALRNAGKASQRLASCDKW